MKFKFKCKFYFLFINFQFRVQSTLTGVAQAVVDKIVRIHHDFYMSRTGSDQVEISKREDITLLIRNFNFPLPNAISPSHPTAHFPLTTPGNPLKDDTISGIFGAHLEEEKNYCFVQC